MEDIPGNSPFHEIKRRLLRRFGHRKILAILAYGTRLTNNALADRFSDYDVTVVFRENPRKSLPPLPAPTNLTVLFWPDIKAAGTKNFRLYNHGEFYILVLAEAIPLYGRNPFKKLARQLPKRNVFGSLKEQILMHCSKLADIALASSSARQNRDICKYSFRIAQNFHFLTERKVNYGNFAKKNYEGWTAIFAESGRFPRDLLLYLKRLSKSRQTVNTREILKFTHRVKTETFKTYGRI